MLLLLHFYSLAFIFQLIPMNSLQDLHKGYYTELDRCRQFTPDKQFSMSSHWTFFPITKDRLEDRFVDVTERCKNEDIPFDADKSGIGKKAKLAPRIEGDNAYFDFYDPDEWEDLELGVFGPEWDDRLDDEDREAYKEHMRIQMKSAKEWRKKVLGEKEAGDSDDNNAEFIPPLVAMATDAVPTVNQILRRKRKASPLTSVTTRKGRSPLNRYEYDYVNGRAVPGDGRIDFDKAFPPYFAAHKRIALSSAHAKQMCWEESGGDWGKIYAEVVTQSEEYLERLKREEDDRLMAIEDSDIRIEEISKVEDTNGRGRSIVGRMAVRARNARKRLRRRSFIKSTNGTDQELVAAGRQRRFSFRRRRRE